MSNIDEAYEHLERRIVDEVFRVGGLTITFVQLRKEVRKIWKWSGEEIQMVLSRLDHDPCSPVRFRGGRIGSGYQSQTFSDAAEQAENVDRVLAQSAEFRASQCTNTVTLTKDEIATIQDALGHLHMDLECARLSGDEFRTRIGLVDSALAKLDKVLPYERDEAS